MRKKKHEEHENAERWLISYADFITLLFAFFVVMYSTSAINEGKLRAVADAINAAFNPFITLSATNIRLTNAQVGEQMFEVDLKLYIKIRDTIEFIDAGQRKITVERDRRGVIIRIADTLVFETGQAEILAQHRPLLDKIAALLAELPNTIQVEGHTDNLPIKTSHYPSNWELSAARATNIVRYFIEQRGLDPQRFAVGGYGEFRPIASNESAAGRAKNRRVDIVVLQPHDAPLSGAGDLAAGAGRDPNAGLPAAPRALANDAFSELPLAGDGSPQPAR